MTIPLRVFINGVGLDVPPGETALGAVRAWNAEAAEAVIAGSLTITDSRGLPVDPAVQVHAGAIFRLVAARGRDATSASDDEPLERESNDELLH